MDFSAGAIIKLLINGIKENWGAIKNLYLRPKIKIDIRQQTVLFIGQDDAEHHYNYFCMIITNNSNQSINLNPRQIKINNELYQVIIQMENNFLKTDKKNSSCWKNCKNDTYKMYRDNWEPVNYFV